MKIGKTRLEVIDGKITDLDVEGIVNPANNMLWLGGGISSEILKKGGEIIEQEAMKKAPAVIGETTVTGAGNLRTRWIFHAVVSGQDLIVTEDAVRKASISCLKRAAEIGCESLAFPMLILGSHDPEIHKVAGIIVTETITYLLNENHSLEYCAFVGKDKGVVEIITHSLMERFTRRG